LLILILLLENVNVYNVLVKKFLFAVSSRDELLVLSTDLTHSVIILTETIFSKLLFQFFVNNFYYFGVLLDCQLLNTRQIAAYDRSYTHNIA